MRVAFKTFGCKVNTYETEALREAFEDAGCSIVPFEQEADAYVINTCAVTAASAAKSRKAIRRAAANGDAFVAVLGCYSQIEPDTVAAISGVDVVFGTDARSLLVETVLENTRHHGVRKAIHAIEDMKTVDALSVARFTSQTRAFVKIQDGCDRFCTYCVIPHARGRQRDRPANTIIEEAEGLVAAGHKEIVLTGIHVGAYGGASSVFCDLLGKLAAIDGLQRIRLSSIEMRELDEGVIDRLASSPVFARHIHLPLQSASSSVLKRMGRTYDMDAFSSKVDAIRKAMPEAAITTDVMVGFPGESDDDFELTHDAVKTLRFSDIHVFPFSPRPLTKAATYTDRVADAVKKARVAALLKTTAGLRRRFLLHKLDIPLRVLFERCENGYCYGHTSEYIFLKVRTPRDLQNTMADVVLEDITADIPLARML